MKKLHLALDMSNLSSGGSISVLLRYMRYWHECGLEMTVYYSRRLIREEIERSALPVKLVEVGRGFPTWKIFLFRCFKLGKLIRRDGADLVYCVNSVLLLCSVPQVVHMRNLQHFVEPSYWRQFLRGGLYEVLRDWVCRYSVRHADCCVYVSDYLKNAATHWQTRRNRQLVIHNPVSEELSERAERRSGENNFDRSLVVGVFNDYPHKDAPTFFRTLAELAARRPECGWRAVVVGNGEWRRNYGKLLAELKIEDRVEFPGYIPADKIAFCYAQAFCMMSTSRLESFNNTPLEAMALGCPAVISDCCAHREVAGDAALFVSPGSAGEFADAILRLKQDRELYDEMRERGFARVKNFRQKVSGRKFVEVFEDVADESTRSGGRGVPPRPGR